MLGILLSAFFGIVLFVFILKVATRVLRLVLTIAFALAVVWFVMSILYGLGLLSALAALPLIGAIFG